MVRQYGQSTILSDSPTSSPAEHSSHNLFSVWIFSKSANTEIISVLKCRLQIFGFLVSVMSHEVEGHILSWRKSCCDSSLWPAKNPIHLISLYLIPDSFKFSEWKGLVFLPLYIPFHHIVRPYTRCEANKSCRRTFQGYKPAHESTTCAVRDGEEK